VITCPNINMIMI